MTVKDYNLDRTLQRKYGMSLLEKCVLFEIQSRRCPICLREFASLSDACVDHDHKTGAVRGLLCSRCNGAVGMLGDSSEGLLKAFVYLKAAELHPFIVEKEVLPDIAPLLEVYAKAIKSREAARDAQCEAVTTTYCGQ